MGGHFKYIGFLTLAVMVLPVLGHNQSRAYGQALSFSDQARNLQGVASPDASKTLTGGVATSKFENYPSLGSSYSDYTKNYEVWKKGLSLTDLIRGSELGETSGPMSQAHWQHQVQSESTGATFFPSPQTNKTASVPKTLSFSDQARNLQGVASPDASKTLTGGVATSKFENYPSLGSSYSDYTKNYEVWKKGLSLTDLIRGSELGETSGPMSQAHWQHQVQSESVTPLVKENIPTSTTADYNAMVAKNKAEYESLKAQVNNVPAMIAAKQCAPAGSIVAGPIPACPTSADLANLLNKNQAKEKALLAEAGGTTSVAASGSGNSASSNCAPAGSIVAGPVPACPTTSVQKGLSAAGSTGVSTAAATAPTVADYNAMVAKNKAEYESLKAQVNNVPAMIAAKQCAPAGSIVAGPIPACPTSADLANLLNKNQAKEKALLAQVGSTTAVAASGSGNSGSSNCAPAGIVAGPLPPCPTTAATQASVSAGVSGAAAAAPTVAQYQALVAKNNAEYESLKAQVNNVPAMIAAKQCAPAGSIVAGPIPACPTSADLAKLAAKNSQQEQVMLAAMAGSSVAVADNAVKCAPAGSIVAGPIPACPTGTNTSGIQTTSPVVNINPEAMAATKCAPAGSIVAGPIPACPTVTALSSGATSLKGAALEASAGPVWATQ